MKRQWYAVSFFCKGGKKAGGIIKLVKAKNDSEAYAKVLNYLNKHRIHLIGDMDTECEVI